MPMPLTNDERLIRIEDRIGYLVSNAETEKENLARINLDIEQRIRKLEKTMWAGIGALAILQMILHYVK